METVTLETIHKDLEFVKKEIIEMKEYIIDEDRILTDEEKRLIDESLEEEKKGKLVRLEEVKNKLGIK